MSLCIYSLSAPSVAKNTSRMIKDNNNDVLRVSNKPVVASFKVLSKQLLGNTKETHAEYQNCRCPSRQLKQTAARYKT
jgi:hypothetical protein